MMRRLLLLAIVFLGFLQNSYAQSMRERIHLAQNAYDLILPEGKVRFAFDSKKVIVKLKAGVNPTAFFKENSSLFAPYNEDWKVPFPEVYRPVLRGASGKTYEQAVAQLEANVDVAYVAPVVQYRGLEQSLYDLLYVKLKSASDFSFLQAQARELGFTIGEKQEGNIYSCRVDKTSAGNSFEIASALQSLHRFAFAEPDFIYTCKPSTSDPSFNAQWYLNNTGSSAQYSGTAGADMKVTQAWGITTGVSTIRVAVLDCFGSTAQFTHPDITFAATYDATGTGFVSSGFSGDAHGICCAGIISATANNNLGGAGVAYNAGVVAVKLGTITNSSGNWNGTGTSIANGITWAYQNTDIISNSNTFGSSNSLINTAIANGLTSGRNGKGTLFFSSAGNSNTTTIGYPASNANTVAVAATSMCDQRKSPTSCDGETWWGSDYGVGVDIGAPGVKIYTTDLPGTPGYSTGDYAATFNGTSSACPAAAAVMALILSANPNLSATSARALMESTCAKVGGYTYNASVSGQPNGTWCTDLGYGRVDAFAALSALNPCSGTPGTTTISAPTSACNGVTFTISSNASANGGITYQWESSANGASGWNAISGATNSTLSVSNLSATTYYRQLVTCTNSNQAVYSNVVSVAFTPAAQCYCTPATTGATTYNITNFTTTGGLTNINNTSSGGSGYQNFSTTASASASPGMAIGYSMTVAGNNTYGRAIWIDFNENGLFTDAGEQVASSTSYLASPMTGSFTIPAGTTAGTKRMRILASFSPANPSNSCVLSSTGEYEDYGFVVNALNACTGTPNAPTISAPASACNGVTFTISSNASANGGITYQWESSANGASGWNAISGATNSTLSVSNLSATTFYRQLVTCTNSNQAVYSNVVSVTLLSAAQCYCTPVITTQDELITNVTVAGINNPNTGFGTSGYQDFTSITGTMQIGASYPFSATIAPYYSSDAIAVWIDYDQNGVFDNPGERVLLKAPTTTPSTGIITVPATALTGNTRMRVRLDYNNTNPTPCGNTSYGNVEDYTINITPCATQSVTATASTLTPCEGTSVTFTAVPANGGATPQYQWKVDGTAASGATSATYTTSFPANAQVSVVMTPTTPCPATPTVESSVLNVTVTPTVVPSVSIVASANPAVAGRSITFTATPTNGGTSPQYQWLQNGTATGGNSSVFTSNTLNDGDIISCEMTNNETCATPAIASSSIAMTVTPDTCSTSITASGPITFCAGGSVTLTAGAGSSYLWSNGETTGAITVTVGGNYSVKVTNSDGCEATSSMLTVTVNAVPDFTLTASGALSFCDGGSVTLALHPSSVVPASASYQWLANGLALPGATQASYTATAWGSYALMISDANGCSNTSVAQSVVVNPVPAASINASGPTTFCAGGSVTLTASAGDSYLWSNGATTSSITVNASGTYSVTVTNASGCSATSPNTTVAVNPLPVVSISTTGPNPFCPGSSVVLDASPNGAGYTYEWKLGTTTLSTTTPQHSATTAGSYTVTVTDDNGCVSASPAFALTVKTLPSVTLAASGPTTFCSGGSVTLSPAATSTNLSGFSNYEWLNNGVAIPGATALSYTASTSGSYTLRASDNNGCGGTSTARVVVMNPAPIASFTAPASFCAGTSATLQAAVYPGQTYTWLLNGTAFSTATTRTITTGGTYQLRATLGSCTTLSPAQTITMNALPVASISGPNPICAGSSTTLMASPAGAAGYRWTYGSTVLPSTTAQQTASAAGSYRVAVTDANGCTGTSATFNLLVKTPPTFSVTPSVGTTTFCAGGSVTLRSTTTSAAFPNYQWMNNGVAISGATAATYTTGTAGNYALIISDSTGCSSMSAARAVVVNPAPIASFTASGPTVFCAGGSVVLTAASYPSQTYVWFLNGAAVGSGAVRTATTGGSYQVRATLGSCLAFSPATPVTVNPLPAAAISTTGPNPFCAGNSVVLNAAPLAANNTYSWTLGTTVLPTTTAQHSATAGGSYKVTVTDGNGCTKTSATYSLTMSTMPSATITALGSTTIGAGGSVTLQTNSASTLTYQWYRNNMAISGATTRNYIATSGGSYTVRVTNGACTRISAARVVTQTAGKESLGVTAGGSDAMPEDAFSFSAFPNPADNKVTVRTNGAVSQSATVQVMTLTGAAVKEMEMQDGHTEIDLSGMASGVYLLRYKDAEGRTGIIRLVKQ